MNLTTQDDKNIFKESLKPTEESNADQINKENVFNTESSKEFI